MTYCTGPRAFIRSSQGLGGLFGFSLSFGLLTSTTDVVTTTDDNDNRLFHLHTCLRPSRICNEFRPRSLFMLDKLCAARCELSDCKRSAKDCSTIVSMS